ncbi:DUF1697 domain-containing protein [Pararhizobium sp.]|uniref:DUF1697 domain-containing protein n=1 Tax=Pararhizobium sp. TaxID=1977563 RepID=UPI00271CA70E|nr:DUF1697 domain-containing protein [Pararhizobium sp.]MDO9417279.1 DUF1697 domain-containing protein [Pararhizobium sp.]
MPVHIALLRAVNVGGTGSLPMAALKAMCEALGFDDVKTYIQSGNVLFRSDLDAAEAGRRLDAALADRLGKKPGVLMRRAADLRSAADGNPFPDAQSNLLHVVFLPDKAPADALDSMVAPDGEVAHVAGREIYVHYPNGSGRSKLKLPALKPGTARNLNTVRKLAEMAEAMEAENG